MLFLAKLIMKDPMWSLMVCAGLGIATLMFSPVGLLAGAAIALVTLSAGLTHGLRALGATVLAGFLAATVFASTTQFWLSLLEFWGMAFILAVALGYTSSLSKAVSVAAVSAFILLALMHIGMKPSPEIVWAAYLDSLISELQNNNVYLEPEVEVLFSEQLPSVLTLLMVMGLLSVWLGELFLARWWQKQLYSEVETSFGAEFRALHLPKSLAIAFFAGFVALVFVPDQVWISEAMAVLSIVFGLQGLALLHHWVFVKDSGKVWLIAVYLMLVILPHFMMMVAVLGWMENWLDWRSKMSANR